jgi:hypothetical protein
MLSMIAGSRFLGISDTALITPSNFGKIRNRFFWRIYWDQDKSLNDKNGSKKSRTVPLRQTFYFNCRSRPIIRRDKYVLTSQANVLIKQVCKDDEEWADYREKVKDYSVLKIDTVRLVNSLDETEVSKAVRRFS